jgi:hypothetical protein
MPLEGTGNWEPKLVVSKRETIQRINEGLKELKLTAAFTVGLFSEDWEYTYWSCPNGKPRMIQVRAITKTSEMMPCFVPQDCI